MQKRAAKIESAGRSRRRFTGAPFTIILSSWVHHPVHLNPVLLQVVLLALHDNGPRAGRCARTHLSDCLEVLTVLAGLSPSTIFIEQRGTVLVTSERMLCFYTFSTSVCRGISQDNAVSIFSRFEVFFVPHHPPRLCAHAVLRSGYRICSRRPGLPSNSNAG